MNAAKLRAAHTAALAQVKSTIPPGHPTRLALLKRLDSIAAQIRIAQAQGILK
jgi:hypothetical protein